MLGFIIGAVCAVGLVKALRRRRAWHARFGCSGHPYGYGYDDETSWGGPRRRGGPWMLRSLLGRLETTPGQERAIVSALDELRENRRVIRDELRQTRADLARAIEGGLIEDSSFEEVFARHDRLLAQVRVSFTEAVKKISEVLDEPQRKRLARWLEGGFFRAAMPWSGSERVWA